MRIIFLFNLLQDVNILRGLAHLAARETDARLHFLVSTGFTRRDTDGEWQRRIAAMANALDAKVVRYSNAEDASAAMAGGRGLIVAASESTLEAHWETSEPMGAAPPSYLKITLQHGLECVGFRQSREHDVAHGHNIRFAADIVCAWFGPDRLTSMAPSERGKLVVTGPATMLQAPPAVQAGDRGGLVCENMHSVRLRATGDHKVSFMEMFDQFAATMGEKGRTVTLRPHPGGQYFIKNNVPLPDNVEIENRPIFEVDLSQFDYGISAPSTIVLDMVLAGISVAVWRDPAGVMDASAYAELTAISTIDDWLAFERDVRLRPDMILARQARFLEASGLILDRAEIYRRFAGLLNAGLATCGMDTAEIGPVVGFVETPSFDEESFVESRL